MKPTDLNFTKGTFSLNVNKYVPGGILNASQITNLRRTTAKQKSLNEKLRDNCYWTSDSAMYTIEQNQPILYLGGTETNLIFSNIPKATNEISVNGFYRPQIDEIRNVKWYAENGNAMRICLSDLELNEDYKEIHSFQIRSSCLQAPQLNNAQYLLATKIYGGTGKNRFQLNMKMLDKNSLVPTFFSILSPDYIRENVRGEGAIVRACSLSDVKNGSTFNAAANELIYSGNIVGDLFNNLT